MEPLRVSFPECNPQLPAGETPNGFDPAATPILAIHWFGVEPWRPIGDVAAHVILRLPRESNA